MTDKNKNKNDDLHDFVLKPGGAYLDSLSGFADLLGSLEKAEKAAGELLQETAKPIPKEEAAPTPATAPEKPDLETLLAQLESLVGLQKIKENVKSLINLVKVRKLREASDLAVPPLSLHMVFMGNPGTGKTTVARILAEVYSAIGVLSKGQLIEVDRSGLVAGFVGQTAIKTGDVIKSALGGMLFIDEAYALTASDGGNDFGHEAVETLLKAMEDHRDDLIVVVAGYSELMHDFIGSNPGLQSRFNRYLLFEDYASEELLTIFKNLCQKNDYLLEAPAESFAGRHFQELYDRRDENFGNARDVRNFFETAVSVHSDRVSTLDSPTREALMTFTQEDLEQAATHAATATF